MKRAREIFLAACMIGLPLTASAQEDVSGTVTRTAVGPGWAKTSVNTTIFRTDPLVTHDGLQYIAFYNPQGVMVLGKRRLDGDGRWELRTTRHRGNVKDAHNTICIGVDGAGYLHVAWDHHGHRLNYCRSVRPGSLELTGRMKMTGRDEEKVTYPEFFMLPDGGLLFMYRDGSSGNGRTMLNRYDLRMKRWIAVQHPLIDGQGERNAYTNQVAVDARGCWHITWCWRETGDVASNHDLCYAVSRDNGRSWHASTGERYTLPITADSAEYIRRIPMKSGLINQTTTAVDSKGRPMTATYWRPEGSDVPQYHLVWFDGEAWRTVQVSSRTTPFSLSGPGTKRIPVSRPKLLVDDRDRIYLLFRDEERGNCISVSVCDDPSRSAWRTFDLSREDVGLWEPSYDSALWRNERRLHLFVQRVGQGDGETLEDVPPQTVSVYEWIPPGAGGR